MTAPPPDDVPLLRITDSAGELSIETPGFMEVELEESHAPSRKWGYEVVACGRPGGVPRLFVLSVALGKVLDHVNQNHQTEMGGVLLGRNYLSRGKLVTEVRDCLAAELTHAGRDHVTFSHETWATIFAQVDRAKGLSMIGWYHSHPNFGIFLSRNDMFIQENFFDGKGHIALVVDPVKHEMGAFVWRGGRVVPAGGLYLAIPDEHGDAGRRLVGMLHYRAGREAQRKRGWLARLLRRG